MKWVWLVWFIAFDGEEETMVSSLCMRGETREGIVMGKVVEGRIEKGSWARDYGVIAGNVVVDQRHKRDLGVLPAGFRDW